MQRYLLLISLFFTSIFVAPVDKATAQYGNDCMRTSISPYLLGSQNLVVENLCGTEYRFAFCVRMDGESSDIVRWDHVTIAGFSKTVVYSVDGKGGFRWRFDAASTQEFLPPVVPNCS